MDVDFLISAWKAGEKIPAPFFGGKEVELFFENEQHIRECAPALISFFALTIEDRDSASHHAFAYFRDFADQVGFDEGWIEAGMEAITEPGPAIWDYVYPGVISGGQSWDIGDRNVQRIFIELETDCGWEEEHGMQMCWRDGKDLVKVSAYDGHATNGHAYSDPSKDAFVYYSSNSAYCTPNPHYQG